MKILFAMDRRADRGSIQAVASYVRAGDELGHTIALYGCHDPRFPGVRFSTDISTFDYVVFIIESWRWLTGLRMPRILPYIPRWRRAILDADGMYNQMISVDSYDRNYVNEWDRSEWLAHYKLIADKILQPTFEPLEPEVKALLFYGYNSTSQISTKTSPPKRFDILHVGHNWWRWQEISNSLLPAIEQIRPLLGEICFMGSWWDAVPAGAHDLNIEKAFGFDIDRFRRLHIQVKPPVHFTEVISAMSEGHINIMTQRPLFRRLKILTSKYFEIFSADTIPLVMLDPDHAELVYGPAGRELVLHDGIAEKLLDTLNQPRKYYEIVQKVRHHLTTHHSYHNRVQELVMALQS